MLAAVSALQPAVTQLRPPEGLARGALVVPAWLLLALLALAICTAALYTAGALRARRKTP